MSQAVKFIGNYFNNNEDFAPAPEGRMVNDDSSSMFDQGFGKAKTIKFADYRKSFAGCALPNVKVFLAQAEALRAFNDKSPMTKEQEKNPDFALSVAEIFGAVVYGQLVFEKARLEGIEDMVVDQLFSYLVRDINMNALRQLGEYAGHLETGQREALTAIIKDPSIDFQLEEELLADYVFPLDGAYRSNRGVVINE
jgi:acyl-CoA dehydrogenase